GLQLPGGVPMPTIHWRDSGNNLRQSDAATARAIFRAGAQGYMCAQTAPIITDAYPLGVVYTIDLQRMVQRNPFTGRERDVVVQFPHNPLELLKLALGATGQDRKQLLGATLEAFCSEDNVMKMLAGKISPYQIIAKRRNPNLQLGQPVFDKFVQSMEGIATGCANLSPSNLVDGQTQASGLPLPLQLAFHGTPPENINSIFKEGMRSSQHWFGCHASISRSYVTPSRTGPRGPVWKLILFVLLMVRTVISSRSDSVVVMTSAHHELPVYEITFQGSDLSVAAAATSAVASLFSAACDVAQRLQANSSHACDRLSDDSADHTTGSLEQTAGTYDCNASPYNADTNQSPMEIIPLTGSGNACIQLGLGVGGASASFYQRLGSGTGRLVAAAVAASTRAAGPLVASHIAHRIVWLQPAKGLLQPPAAAVTPAVVGPAGPGLGALPVGVARLPIAMRQSAIGGLLSLSAAALGVLGWARACSAEDERIGARSEERGEGSCEESALGQGAGEDEVEAVVSQVASVAEGRKRPRETDGGSVPHAWMATASVGAERGMVVEPKTKHSFPVMLRQEGQGGGLLAGVGIRDTVIARIKSVKIYAFGLYVSPSSLGGDEHLKAKYSAMPLDELRVSQEFYDDLLSRDIGMTVRLVLHYRGLSMKMVR
ncbi:unnamed protein product, partial [Closterium sp. NIES-53]